jgi:CHASE2 domain-containing sensor protein
MAHMLAQTAHTWPKLDIFTLTHLGFLIGALPLTTCRKENGENTVGIACHLRLSSVVYVSTAGTACHEWLSPVVSKNIISVYYLL